MTDQGLTWPTETRGMGVKKWREGGGADIQYCDWANDKIKSSGGSGPKMDETAEKIERAELIGMIWMTWFKKHRKWTTWTNVIELTYVLFELLVVFIDELQFSFKYRQLVRKYVLSCYYHLLGQRRAEGSRDFPSKGFLPPPPAFIHFCTPLPFSSRNARPSSLKA